MIIEKIYLDMDGVLADFDRGVREFCNMENPGQSVATPEQDDEMWALVRKIDHFYDKLELMPGALNLYKELREKYGEKVEILSGIPRPHRGLVGAGEDKTIWAHRIIDESLVVNIVYRAEKKNYVTGPGCILIDDLQKNIDEWEAAGGTGILYEIAEQVLETMRSLK